MGDIPSLIWVAPFAEDVKERTALDLRFPDLTIVDHADHRALKGFCPPHLGVAFHDRDSISNQPGAPKVPRAVPCHLNGPDQM